MKHCIGKEFKIDVVVSRAEANFDRACDAAMARALHLYGADDNGHLLDVLGHQRSTDEVILEFQTVIIHAGMTGQEHNYKFHAWIERSWD